MEELIYWKLKAKLAEIEINEIQLMNKLNSIRIEKRNLFSSNGLDINKLYTFDDENHQFVEDKNGEQTTGRNNQGNQS